VNNLYQGWMQYAIGGSMNPSVKSQANLFIAPKSGNKEVISVLPLSFKKKKSQKKKLII
jgi:pectate lyase